MSAVVRLGPMATSDVVELARLHRQAFPGFFLSSLGEPFLVQFYRGFLRDKSAVTVVVRDDLGIPRGACVGTTDAAGFFGRLLKSQWPGFVWASARVVLKNPRSASRLMHAITYRGGTSDGVTGALLSSICIDPKLQGSGAGGLLIDEWVRVVTSKGANQAVLLTDAVDNERVNRFYQARGWQLNDTFSTREGRQMNRYLIVLPTQ